MNFPDDDAKVSIGQKSATAADVEFARINGRVEVLRTEVMPMKSQEHDRMAALNASTAALNATIAKLDTTIKYRGITMAIAIAAGLVVLYGGYKAVEVIASFVDTVSAAIGTGETSQVHGNEPPLGDGPAQPTADGSVESAETAASSEIKTPQNP